MERVEKGIEKLIKSKLAQPVYFKVVQNSDGGLSIEQVQFVDTKGLAALAMMDPRTIRSWVAKGIIKFYKPPGSSRILFEINEALTFLINRDRSGQ